MKKLALVLVAMVLCILVIGHSQRASSCDYYWYPESGVTVHMTEEYNDAVKGVLTPKSDTQVLTVYLALCLPYTSNEADPEEITLSGDLSGTCEMISFTSHNNLNKIDRDTYHIFYTCSLLGNFSIPWGYTDQNVISGYLEVKGSYDEAKDVWTLNGNFMGASNYPYYAIYKARIPLKFSR
jgi:hypothetical protein